MSLRPPPRLTLGSVHPESLGWLAGTGTRAARRRTGTQAQQAGGST